MIANTTVTSNLRQTLKYVFKKNSQTVYANFSSALSGNWKAIASDMEAMAKSHSSSRLSAPGYHISLSPAPGDELSADDWCNLANDFVEQLGVDRHWVVGVLHSDTVFPDSQEPRIHAHFVINRLSPTGTLNLKYAQIEQVVRQLETQYQLQALDCSWDVHRRQQQTFTTQQESTMTTVSLSATSTTFPSGEQPLTMKDLLRQSRQVSPSTPESSAKKVGQALQQSGQRLEQQAEEIDGQIVIGATVALTGNAVLIADAVAHRLQEARQQTQIQRVEAIIEGLEQIHQRTSNLEAHFEAQSAPFSEQTTVEAVSGFEEAVPSEPELDSEVETEVADFDIDENPPPDWAYEAAIEADSASAQSPPSSVFDLDLDEDVWADTPPQSFEDQAESDDSGRSFFYQTVEIPEASTEDFAANPNRQRPLHTVIDLSQQRLSQLEEQWGQPLPTDSIEIDRKAPIEFQLDQIEQVIKQFGQRLERLESVAFQQEVRVEQQVAEYSSEEIAERIFNYVNARAETYGVSPEESVETTIGTLKVQIDHSGSHVSLSDSHYGSKFEAIYLNQSESNWEVITNDLSSGEMQRLMQLPQDVESYERQANAKDLIDFFKRHAPEQFSAEGGRIHWQTGESNQFFYKFEIESNDDGSQSIIGTNATDDAVFKARIESTGVIRADVFTIPTEQINDVLMKESQADVNQQRSTQLNL